MPCPSSSGRDSGPSVHRSRNSRNTSRRRGAMERRRGDGQPQSLGQQRMVKILSSSSSQSGSADGSHQQQHETEVTTASQLPSLSSAKRRLFASDDEDMGDEARRLKVKRISSENIQFAKLEEERHHSDSCLAWDFDFRNGCPLPSARRYEWFKGPLLSLPQPSSSWTTTNTTAETATNTTDDYTLTSSSSASALEESTLPPTDETLAEPEEEQGNGSAVSRGHVQSRQDVSSSKEGAKGEVARALKPLNTGNIIRKAILENDNEVDN